MRKKIIALLLGISAIISSISCPAYAAELKAVDDELLPLLEIMTGEEPAGEYVTRAELARYAIRLIHVQVTPDEAETPIFADTQGEDISYINAANRYGLMFGRSETEFAPADACTQLEMCTVLLRAAQYNGFAESLGGYDDGYIQTASTSGLLTGNIDQPVTHAQAEKMIARVLAMEVPEILIAGDRISVDMESDEMVLERYFDIRPVEGRIVAVGNYVISGYEPVGINHISILTPKGVESYASDAGVEVLGYRVRAYVQKEFGGEKTFYIKTLTDSVNELHLMTGEIVDVSEDMERVEYLLNQTTREKTAKLSEETQYIYNGVPTYGVTPEDLDVKNGNITMIDVNLDRIYDLVHIWSYDAYIVDGKNTTTLTVTDKVTKKIIDADVYHSDYEIKIYKNGREINITAINEWDVLLVAETREAPKKRTIIVSTGIVEGKLEQIGEDYLLVDGEEIPILPSLDKTQLFREQNYLFGLNLNGQICVYKQRTNLSEYFAYMYKLYHDDTDINKVYAKVLTQDNEYKVLEFAENFRLNGERSEYEALFNLMSNDGYFVPQMVMIETNSAGLVRRIYITDEVTEPTANQKKGLYQNFSSDTAVYKSGSGTIGGFWLIGPDTKIFEIYKKGNGIDTETSKITPKNLFRLSDGVKPEIKIYNSATDRVANVAVIHYNAGMPIFKDDNHTRQIVVVDSVEDKLLESGEIVQILKGTHLGQLCEYRISPEAKNMEILKRGDCIYGAFNSENILYGYELRFSQEQKAEHNRFDYLSAILFGDKEYVAEAAYGNVNNTRHGMIGTVVEKVKVGSHYAAVIRAIGSNQTYIYPTDAGSYVYTLSERSGKPQPSSMENLDIGSQVFIAGRYGYARDIFVYAD